MNPLGIIGSDSEPWKCPRCGYELRLEPRSTLHTPEPVTEMCLICNCDGAVAMPVHVVTMFDNLFKKRIEKRIQESCEVYVEKIRKKMEGNE